MQPSFQPRPPDYQGGSLVNLMAEIEWRMVGSAPSARLHPDLASAIPDARTVVMILMDGLGSHQLDHARAASLRRDHKATIDAPFPTTTTVSLSTVATGLEPVEHGLLGHHIWLPEQSIVANSLKWIARGGLPVDIDTSTYLPEPNMWERLERAGIEPITVQPGHFAATPLTKALYRGCRFEPIWDNDEFARAIVELSASGARFIFGYLPEVDFAAHLFGQRSLEYADAVQQVNATWEAIVQRLPADVALIGTADHGHVDYSEQDKFFVDRTTARGLELFGDPRALYAKGDPASIARCEAALPATWFDRADLIEWWGTSTAPRVEVTDRMPDGVFLADPGRLLIPGHMDKRLIGYHGGLDPRELKIPLLTAEHR